MDDPSSDRDGDGKVQSISNERSREREADIAFSGAQSEKCRLCKEEGRTERGKAGGRGGGFRQGDGGGRLTPLFSALVGAFSAAMPPGHRRPRLYAVLVAVIL